MYSKYQITKILEFFFRNINCFCWIKPILVLIHLKYWYHNSPYAELPLPPSPSLPNFTLANWNHLQYNPHHVLHRFPYFFLRHSTTSHHKYWIYQAIYKAKPIEFVIKLYTDHDTLFVKHGTHQKAEPLKTASLSDLDNMVNSSSTFNTKYSEFYTKW